MIRRDYIERLIAQVVQAIAVALELARSGDFDAGLRIIRQTAADVLGPLAPVIDRLSAASAVELVGRFELDRIRLYAALLAEEGAILSDRGDSDAANRCFARSLDLYDAGAEAGLKLLEADEVRISGLRRRLSE